jgi:hypothetical protein
MSPPIGHIMLFLLNGVCLVEKQQIQIVFGLTQQGLQSTIYHIRGMYASHYRGSNPRSTTLEASMLVAVTPLIMCQIIIVSHCSVIVNNKTTAQRDTVYGTVNVKFRSVCHSQKVQSSKIQDTVVV